MLNTRRITGAVLFALAMVLATLPLRGAHAPSSGNQAAAQAQVPATVPADLTPLIAPRASEMRLVVTRYELDRGTLSSNSANGATRGNRCSGGGRACGAA